MALLEVDNLSVTLATARGPARAVRGVSFALERGETLGIVGESGCGKSLTALALMGLLPENARATGRVVLDGIDLAGLNEDALCRIRGNRVGMIFQEPMTSLNPLHPVGRQIGEALATHRGLGGAALRAETLELLGKVGIPEPERRIRSYPHELSGGQRQRVMIAMALSCRPEILIADEPTTALDVTVQKQILDLIRDLVRELGMALILISHDLGVIAENVGRIAVMYGGTIVEAAPTAALFADLAHPYAQGLFAAVPRVGWRRDSNARLATIPGVVPDLPDLPNGCTFAERCTLANDACRAAAPMPIEVGPNHSASCIRTDAARLSRKSA
ncbi:MAG: ABC transporter ATP-binding protein [Alphaproteobacteria bacterium]|nr:ABC transporter ATP-binding protein [Alphaproteobacteria bacterium]